MTDEAALLERQAARQIEAHDILADLGLPAPLESVGRPFLAGSYVLDLMVWRDIDYYVVVADAALTAERIVEVVRPLPHTCGLAGRAVGDVPIIGGHTSRGHGERTERVGPGRRRPSASSDDIRGGLALGLNTGVRERLASKSSTPSWLSQEMLFLQRGGKARDLWTQRLSPILCRKGE